MIQPPRTTCPKCHSREFKAWDDLDRDERLAAAVQPNISQLTPSEQKKHRVCTRCWFEQIDPELDLA